MRRWFSFALGVILLAACAVTAGNPDRPRKLERDTAEAENVWIDKRSPAGVRSGERVTIVGSKFGTKRGKVLMSGTAAKVLAWSPGEITFAAPETAASSCARFQLVDVEGEATPSTDATTAPTAVTYVVSNVMPLVYGENNLWVQASDVPAPRAWHTAAWTGRELIILGGTGGASGARYNPKTDSWTPIASFPVFPPSVTVWTGKELLTFGMAIGMGETGATLVQSAAYNPETDAWRWLATQRAPRTDAVLAAVSAAGKVYVLAGGGSVILYEYDPLADVWRSESTKIPLSAAVNNNTAMYWTGKQILVWNGTAQDSGSLYDPTTKKWAKIGPGAPPAEYMSYAFWTGEQLIVVSDAPYQVMWLGRYDPESGNWSNRAISGLPWLGDMNFNWNRTTVVAYGGGSLFFVGTFGGGWQSHRYDLKSNRLHALPASGGPTQRWAMTATWIGQEVVIWGGYKGYDGESEATGFRYLPATDSWTPTAVNEAPIGEMRATTLWTGGELLVVGKSVKRYNPVLNQWSPAAALNQPALTGTAAVWNGNRMVVTGADANGAMVAASYQPSTDVWEPASYAGGNLAARTGYTLVWANGQALIWGGKTNASLVNTGAAFNPATRLWAALAVTGAPEARWQHTAIWTGDSMLVYGGIYGMYYWNALGTGGKYDPAADTWSPMASGPVMERPSAHLTNSGITFFNTGGQSHLQVATYNVALDTWSGQRTSEQFYISSSTIDGHRRAEPPPVVWTGSQFVAFGARAMESITDAFHSPYDGLRYDPQTGVFSPIGSSCDVFPGAGSAGVELHAVWTGERALVWAPNFGLQTYFP